MDSWDWDVLWTTVAGMDLWRRIFEFGCCFGRQVLWKHIGRRTTLFRVSS